MITDSFPKERLSSAVSVYTMGIQLGSGLALVIGGLVAQAVSHMAPVAIPVAGFIPAWRVTFLIVGAPGLLVALLLATLREPTRRALLLSSTGVAAALGLGEVLAHIRLRWRAVFGVSAMISCQATCNYALLAWGPGGVLHRLADRMRVCGGATDRPESGARPGFGHGPVHSGPGQPRIGRAAAGISQRPSVPR
jgi:MFS family permease